MYNLENFEPYTLRKSLDKAAVLAWSRKNGYHFLSFNERVKAEAKGEQVNIIAVEKSK